MNNAGNASMHIDYKSKIIINRLERDGMCNSYEISL